MIKIGDKVQIFSTTRKINPVKQGVVESKDVLAGVECIRLIGSNRTYSIDCASKIESFCKHHPFDRHIDFNENLVCSTCGKIIKSADDLYCA